MDKTETQKEVVYITRIETGKINCSFYLCLYMQNTARNCITPEHINKRRKFFWNLDVCYINLSDTERIVL